MNVFQAIGALAEAIDKHGDPICKTTDPDMWFPDIGEQSGKGVRIAKEYCRQCPVQQECLAYALIANEQYGIWGGYDAMQRRNMRRTNRASEKKAS